MHVGILTPAGFVRALTLFASLLALNGCGAANGIDPIVNARYTDPTERYGHFALGRPHEYARLVVTTESGQTLSLALPADEVFEDLAPRRVRLAPDEPESLLTIISQRERGARLALVQVDASGLSIRARSPAIGQSNRWLSPVGVADLDGDGQAEIAAVITPHIGGTLKIYRQQGHRLVEVAALSGFSNHAYGSPQLGLSKPITIAGRAHLIVPDATRTQLRIIALHNRQLVETGRCQLPAPITGTIASLSEGTLSVVTQAGEQIVALDTCLG
ncbi:MAG: hypothetical protein IV085_02790 [Thiobacillus sp.]|nr:hypothetical protein [Thiobacillus sp.]